jgi:rhamnosyltransferase
MSKVGLIVPTLNAGDDWPNWLMALAQQTRQPDRLLLIDSSSSDDTVALAKDQGFEIRVIDQSAFNHGGTRQWAVELLNDMELIIFLTQDAVLADSRAIEHLLMAFDEPSVVTAYGRQLPHPHACPIAAHAIIFNYPQHNQIRGLADRDLYGIKSAFISNSFAAYRRDVLMQVGGFPLNTIMNEDTFVAGLMLKTGLKIAYQADAQVFHSHDYGLWDDFKRYFDIGVFHVNTPWLQQSFGGVVGDDWRFVLSELVYLVKFAPGLIASAIIRTGLKGLGYKLGLLHKHLPTALKPYLSMHKAYWQSQPEQRVYEQMPSKCKMG